MEQSMDNMLDMYLFETNSLLEQLDEILLKSEKLSCFSDDSINEIFRIMHTIKGSSAMMDFSQLMNIAHKVEDMFFYIRENGIIKEHQNELFDLMFLCNDFIREQVDSIQQNIPIQDKSTYYLEKIEKFLEKIRIPQKLGLQIEKSNTSIYDNSNMKYEVKIFFDESSGMEHLRAFMVINSIRDCCSDFTYYPHNVDSDPESAKHISKYGFLIYFSNEDNLNIGVNIFKSDSNIVSYEIIQIDDKKESNKSQELNYTDKENLKDKQDDKNSKLVHGNKQSIISVNLAKLDHLMNIVGEIVITESMVTSCPEISNMKLESFTKSARQLRKLTDELQNIVMSIRMVPISGVFHKMNRILRDMGQKLSKDVILIIEGEDTEVDKTIVDSISDPIMHLVRNAMDHGIETNPQDRIQQGKSTQGQIILSARHTGSEVLIDIIDDGKGVDPEKVLEKAQKNGLLTKKESDYTKNEIMALLMSPGFSTKEQVTEFSGRGVGMDVVVKNIQKVGGTVSIESELHKGTKITFKIPLTLAIVEGMGISVGNSIFTIPISNVVQSFKVGFDEIIYDTDNREVIKRRGEFYTIIRLHELYEIQTKTTNIEQGVLVLVESGENKFCLFVDELIGKQQVVVKPLPSYLNQFKIKNHGISGCTILGDGSISIILDLDSLFLSLKNNIVIKSQKGKRYE